MVGFKDSMPLVANRFELSMHIPWSEFQKDSLDHQGPALKEFECRRKHARNPATRYGSAYGCIHCRKECLIDHLVPRVPRYDPFRAEILVTTPGMKLGGIDLTPCPSLSYDRSGSHSNPRVLKPTVERKIACNCTK